MFRGPSAERVVLAYVGKYDVITIPKPLPDRYYWGFEDGGDGRADQAAAELCVVVQQATDRAEAVGRKGLRGIREALSESGGMPTPQVRSAIQTAKAEAIASAQEEWRTVGGSILYYSDVDVDPNTSRIALAIGFKQLYRQLAERVTDPTAVELRTVYLRLMDRVVSYFDSV